MTAGPNPTPAGAGWESRDGTLEVDGPFTQANHPAPHRIADLTQQCALQVVDEEAGNTMDDLDSRFAPIGARSVYVLDAINRRKVASGRGKLTPPVGLLRA
jgi:hypothetical protein